MSEIFDDDPLEETFNEARRQQEFSRLSQEKKKKNALMAGFLFSRFFRKKDTGKTEKSGIFTLIIWIVLIVLLKRSNTTDFLGDILLYILLACIFIGFIPSIIKGIIWLFGYLIGFIIKMFLKLIKKINKNLGKDEEKKI